jgi:hypothetical protein
MPRLNIKALPHKEIETSMHHSQLQQQCKSHFVIMYLMYAMDIRTFAWMKVVEGGQ